MVGIPSSSNANDKGQQYWEKQVVDVNNVDESFGNSRDMGYVRLNQARSSVIGKLANNDKEDIYKVQVQSTGKLSLSIKNAEGDDNVLDLSKYEEALDDLRRQTDPVGWEKEQAEKKAKEAEQVLVELTAPGIHLEVFSSKNGHPVKIGDSHAEKGTKTREAMDQMLSGDYRAQKGEYFIKVTRTEDVSTREDLPYVMQVSMGNHKHDYAAKESSSQDTLLKKESTVPMMQSGDGLSSVNAMQIQATKHQATAQMLAVGYSNMASIYNRNSSF